MKEVEKIEEQLLEYLTKKRGFVVSELCPLGGGSSSHINYKLESDTGTYVCRAANPKTFGPHSLVHISDEYTILKLVEPYAIGPKVHSVDLEGFAVPLLLEEYIHNEVPTSETLEDFALILKLIKKVEQVPLTENDFPLSIQLSEISIQCSGMALPCARTQRTCSL